MLLLAALPKSALQHHSQSAEYEPVEIQVQVVQVARALAQ